MSRIAPLDDAARKSDARTDWLKLWQVIAGTRLVVPVADPNAARVQPQVISAGGMPTVLAYEDMDERTAFLQKPFTLEQLRSALDNLLGSQQKADATEA